MVGGQIYVIGAVRNVKNVTTFATLPAEFRPVQNITFPALAYGNAQSNGTILTNGVQSGQTVHIVANFLV